MKLSRKQSVCSGLTLLEVMSVIAIIAICLVLFSVTYDYRENNIKNNLVRAELAILNCHLETYKLQTNDYPTTNSDSIINNAHILYHTLSEKIEPFFYDHKWTIKDDCLIDPWGRPYVYKYNNGSRSYLLLSTGPNGTIDIDKLIDDVYSR